MSISLLEFEKIIGLTRPFNFEPRIKERSKEWKYYLQDPFAERTPIAIGGVYGVQIGEIWIQALVTGILSENEIRVSPVVPWAVFDDVTGDILVLPDTFETDYYSPLGVVSEIDAIIKGFKLGKKFVQVSEEFLKKHHKTGLDKLLTDQPHTQVAELFRKVFGTD